MEQRQRKHQNVYKVDASQEWTGLHVVKTGRPDQLYGAIRWISRYNPSVDAKDAETLYAALRDCLVDRCRIELYGTQFSDPVLAREMEKIGDVFARLEAEKPYVEVRVMEAGETSDGLNEYHIDFSGAQGVRGMHACILEQLPLVPEFYGRNLDALWDVLTGYIDTKSRIVLHGTESFARKDERAYMERIVEVFREAQAAYGEPVVIVAS